MPRRKDAHTKTREARSEQERLEGSLKKQFDEGKGYRISQSGNIETSVDDYFEHRHNHKEDTE